MASGVRQGCPLSPLVYALVAEVLLDKLEQEVDGLYAKAYADDTAIILKDFWASLPTVTRIFEEWAKISGLHLNLAKSVIVPLNAVQAVSFTDRLARGRYGWSAMLVKDACKYLGFQLGPGKGDSSRQAPFKKYISRLNMWKDQPLGLFWDARVYNTFVLPILTYVAQLETPPEWVLEGVISSFSKAAKGPGKWATATDLWTLKEAFGLHASFKSLEWTATAAKARVVAFDAACRPHSRFCNDIALVKDAQRNPHDECCNLAWTLWYCRAFASTTQDAYDLVCRAAGSLEAIRTNRSSSNLPLNEDRLWRKQCQGAVYNFLVAQHLRDPRSRVREKLHRWKLPIIGTTALQNTPAWRAARAHWLLSRLGALVPPRVQAAVFGAIWNRWTTAARFQGSRCCLLCGLGDSDKLQHYCCCRVVRQVLTRRLRLPDDEFANLDSFLLVNPSITSKEVLTLVALLIYGVYDITNKQRQLGRSLGEAAFEAIAQAVRQGARGHAGAINTLDSRWHNPPPSTSVIPAAPLLPYSAGISRWRTLAASNKRKRAGNEV